LTAAFLQSGHVDRCIPLGSNCAWKEPADPAAAAVAAAAPTLPAAAAGAARLGAGPWTAAAALLRIQSCYRQTQKSCQLHLHQLLQQLLLLCQPQLMLR
jgi:hypothetical protein